MSFYSQFADHYEAVFPFQEETCAFLKSGFPPAGRRILDAGCGTGHYCGRLAAEGYAAVGIDLDPEMIRVARARYAAPEFHCLNMLEVGGLTRPFDAVFCIGNTAAHLTQKEFRRFVAGVRSALAPGGAWIFQVMNWDFILTQATYRLPPRPAGETGAVFSREYHDISDSRLRFRTRLASAEATLFEGEVWLYPLRTDELLRIHREADFALVGHYADFKRSPFRPKVYSGSVFVFTAA